MEIETLQRLLKAFLIIDLLIQSYIDLKWKLLLDELNLFLAIVGVVYGYVSLGWQQSFLGAFLFGGLMEGIYLCAQGGMGLGDVKLSAALGFWLGGYGSWYCLVLALFLGAVTGIFGLLTGNYSRQTTLPFGPFLSISALLLILPDISIETLLLQFIESW